MSKNINEIKKCYLVYNHYFSDRNGCGEALVTVCKTKQSAKIKAEEYHTQYCKKNRSKHLYSDCTKCCVSIVEHSFNSEEDEMCEIWFQDIANECDDEDDEDDEDDLDDDLEDEKENGKEA
jgi:hypothetical protein